MPEEKKTALVLSGGSIKGAFQAGALQEVLSSGIQPDAIYGISVGSLNGGFLADRAGKAALAGNDPDWPAIGNELVQFWQGEIDSFDKLGKERGKVSLLWSVIRGKFDGAIDTARLQKLVKQILSEDDLAAYPGIFKAGAVNLISGELVQADQHNSARQLREFIIASTAIPVVMPSSMIGRTPYVDGGARDVATLHEAIADGATRIICILCQEEKMGAAAVDPGNLVEFGDRLMGIVTNETLNNDLQYAQLINELLATGKLQPEDKGDGESYRQLDLTIIRPASPLNIELTDFDTDDIKRLIKLGREAALAQMHS
ncbi:MAG: patatin-like phospholipase family protein [bacterium]